MPTNRYHTGSKAYRGHSGADRTNFGGYIPKGRPLIPQGSVRFLSMSDYRIDLHRRIVKTKTTSSIQNPTRRGETDC